MTEKEARKNRVTVVMGEDLKQKVIEMAFVQDRSVSDFIRLVLKDYAEAQDELEANRAEEELE